MSVYALSGDSRALWTWPAGGGMRNLAWLLVSGSGEAVAVDLPDGRLLLEVLQERGLRLKAVWFTHDHADHQVAAKEVFAATGCVGWAPAGAELPVPVTTLNPGDSVEAAGFRAVALDTSGHSPGDLSYYLPAEGVCFCGDTLFDGGVGRMFAGPAERFWTSHLRLRALPEDTWLCVGHDYAADNYAFACSLLPQEAAFQQRRREAEAGLRFPVTVEDQKQGNVFWRADTPEVARAIGRPDGVPVEVFAALREAKDRF